MADNDNSVGSSSDSDDEYLTHRNDRKGGGGGGNYDREAIVRKKLLENFYGKSAVGTVVTDAVTTAGHAGVGVSSSDDDDDDDDDDDEYNSGNKSHSKRNKRLSSAGKDDLDSPSFDAKAYAAHHIRYSSVHDLLETEDRIALQVRTLESTMQTLVYENYSRFIDATDAIRSIGVNVQANEQGLRSLTTGMEEIDKRSLAIETELGSLRDQVAEKIRIKRLLTRLDTLLKLPQTLREKINQGKYRTATKSFLSASSILKKHSEGFESLKNIETDCNVILGELQQNLKEKILHWSGRNATYDDDMGDSDDDNDPDKSFQHTTELKAPDPPKDMSEIFECAGTLFILSEKAKSENGDDKVNSAVIDTGFDNDELQSMSIAASLRLLDRLLDSHLIEVQEKRFAGSGLMSSNLDGKNNGIGNTDTVEIKPAGSSLIPQDFLDAVLEGATLYGMCFGSADGGSFLMEFVSEALASFFSHVRSILHEESIEASRADENADQTGQDDFNNDAYREISGALILLIQYVSELAAGLALPEVGISKDFATRLVDQTMQLTESIVRRRVEHKFRDLRMNVVRDCLLPFVDRAIEDRNNAINDNKIVLPQLIQVASNTSSNCLQLVDDTIRSIFFSCLADSSADVADLRDAVYVSSIGFTIWLANAFVTLAGGDATNPAKVTEAAFPSQQDDDNNNNYEHNISILVPFTDTFMKENGIDFGGQESDILDMLESAKLKLEDDDNRPAGSVHPDFILAIAELCRISQVSVSDNIRQSISAHAGGNKKKSRGDDAKSASILKWDDTAIANQFKMAASRVVVLYATNLGVHGGNLLCSNLRSDGSMANEELPIAPREAAIEFLTLAKEVAVQCSSIFGGKRRSGPIPEWENDPYSGLPNPLTSRKTGLQLDVERIFKEKISIYPHPSELFDSSKEAVMFLFFKVAGRELVENVRLLSFTIGGFAQILVDILFVKHMVPHYVSSEYNEKSMNAFGAVSTIFADAIEIMEDRLVDSNEIDLEDLKGDARDIVRSFMANVRDDNQDTVDFIIPEEEK